MVCKSSSPLNNRQVVLFAETSRLKHFTILKSKKRKKKRKGKSKVIRLNLTEFSLQQSVQGASQVNTKLFPAKMLQALQATSSNKFFCYTINKII